MLHFFTKKKKRKMSDCDNLMYGPWRSKIGEEEVILHWWIEGGGRQGPGCPILWVQFLWFSCSCQEKFGQIIGLRPYLGGWRPPVWKILDAPLLAPPPGPRDFIFLGTPLPRRWILCAPSGFATVNCNAPEEPCDMGECTCMCDALTNSCRVMSI